MTSQKEKIIDTNRSAAVTHPQMLKLYAHELNTKSIYEITAFSNIKRAWKCSKNHVWKAAPAHIAKSLTTSSMSCPFCYNRKVDINNCAATTNPWMLELYEPNFNTKTLFEVTAGSAQKMWWKCSLKHTWEASLCHMVRSHNDGKAGCPYCSGKKVDINNCVATTHPWLLKLFEPNFNTKTLFEITAGSVHKIWWKCLFGHIWSAPLPRMISSHNNGNTGCPYCNGKKVDITNCAATTHSWMLKLYEPNLNTITLFDVTAHSNKLMVWKCIFGHIWTASVSAVADKRSLTGCKKCQPQTSKPQLIIFSEFKFLFPKTELNKKLEKIELDIFIPELNIAIEYDGYPWHKNKQKRDLRKNKFAAKNGIKIIRMRDERNGKLTEEDILINARKQSVYLCFSQFMQPLIELLAKKINPNSEYFVKISAYLTDGVFKNIYCYEQLQDKIRNKFIENNIKITNPDVVEKTWDYKVNSPLTPEMFSKYSNVKVGWMCDKCGHKWKSLICNRCGRGDGCPSCSKYKKLTQKEIDFAIESKTQGDTISQIAKNLNRKYGTIKRFFDKRIKNI